MKPDYATLMAMRQAFVLVCTQRGHNPEKANEYFTERATKEGWIEGLDEIV